MFEENGESWFSSEYIPDNKRDIIIYSKEFGTTMGYYDNNSFYHKIWKQPVRIIAWREMPHYDECKNSNSK